MSFASDPMDVLSSLNPLLPPTPLSPNDMGSATDPFDPSLSSSNDVPDQLDFWTNVSFSFDVPPGQALPTEVGPPKDSLDDLAQEQVSAITPSSSDRDLTGSALWRQAMVALEASDAQCDLEHTDSSLAVPPLVTTLDIPAPAPAAATSSISPLPTFSFSTVSSTVQAPSPESSTMIHWVHQALKSPVPPPLPSSVSSSSHPTHTSSSSVGLDAQDPPTERARTSPVHNAHTLRDTILSQDDDKRRRNTAASARARTKKKLRAAAFEAEHRALQLTFARLEQEQDQLQRENERLRSTLGVDSKVDLSTVIGLSL